MLSFQVGRAARTVTIACDAKGMATLLGALAQLVGERASHVHLRAPIAGGHELDNGPYLSDEVAHEVTIDYAEGD
jgi:hypothetical protein